MDQKDFLRLKKKNEICDDCIMDRRDALVLAGMVTAASTVISITILLANRIVGNPFI